MQNLWDLYREWLIHDLLRIRNPEKYDDLFRILHDRRFTWILDRDANRADDGLYLRNYFFDYIGCNESETIEEFNEVNYCSVLEMLAALSKRIDGEYIGDPGNPKPDVIFMEMLENLRLTRFWGECKSRDRDNIHNILDRFLDRKYSSSGMGGLFPIHRPMSDQRNDEIWTQMIHYVHENY